MKEENDPRISQELKEIADSHDASNLKWMVDLGMIPYEGAIKEKIDNSPELQLHKAMDQAGLSDQEKLRLIANLLAITDHDE